MNKNELSRIKMLSGSPSPDETRILSDASRTTIVKGLPHSDKACIAFIKAMNCSRFSLGPRDTPAQFGETVYFFTEDESFLVDFDPKSVQDDFLDPLKKHMEQQQKSGNLENNAFENQRAIRAQAKEIKVFPTSILTSVLFSFDGEFNEAMDEMNWERTEMAIKVTLESLIKREEDKEWLESMPMDFLVSAVRFCTLQDDLFGFYMRDLHPEEAGWLPMEDISKLKNMALKWLDVCLPLLKMYIDKHSDSSSQDYMRSLTVLSKMRELGQLRESGGKSPVLVDKKTTVVIDGCEELEPFIVNEIVAEAGEAHLFFTTNSIKNADLADCGIRRKFHEKLKLAESFKPNLVHAFRPIEMTPLPFSFNSISGIFNQEMPDLEKFLKLRTALSEVAIEINKRLGSPRILLVIDDAGEFQSQFPLFLQDSIVAELARNGFFKNENYAIQDLDNFDVQLDANRDPIVLLRKGRQEKTRISHLTQYDLANGSNEGEDKTESFIVAMFIGHVLNGTLCFIVNYDEDEYTDSSEKTLANTFNALELAQTTR